MIFRLKAVLCQTRERKPLATVYGFPGEGADLTPSALRELAAALIRIADDAAARPMGPRSYIKCEREYVAAADETKI